MAVWRFRDRQLDLTATAVMGILNVTPDSFSDGGRYDTVERAVERALAIEREGAAILDIGGQSTRPGHVPVPPEEEWRRLAPVLAALAGKIHLPISIDTYYTDVAERALESGACIINDVSGSLDNGMPALCARYGAGLVMMHNRAGHNTPQDVRRYFETALAAAADAGLAAAHLALATGVGFEKNQEEDARLIACLPSIMEGLFDAAVLVGASRKRVTGAFCGQPPFAERLPATLAIHTVAQWNGANVLRVHDVAAAVQAAAMTGALLERR
ncbi:MAG: dihydropteroate synthase [Acutalibacteraceae bacterium]|jgi:dihydropteroate synthase